MKISLSLISAMSLMFVGADAYTYKGCYVETAAPVREFWMGNGACKTVDDCATYAQSQKASFFGMQWPQGCPTGQAQCWINPLTSGVGNLTATSDSSCSGHQDSANHFLGDAWTNALYERVHYEGCYNDNSNRMLKNGGDCHTVSECSSIALNSGSKYFGMQWPAGCPTGQAQCWVDNTVTSISATNAGDGSCPSDGAGGNFGGPWINAVYSLNPQPITVTLNQDTSTGCYEAICNGQSLANAPINYSGSSSGLTISCNTNPGKGPYYMSQSDKVCGLPTANNF